MTYVIVVLVALGVLAYVFRETLAARLNGLVSKVRTSVSKPDTTVAPNPVNSRSAEILEAINFLKPRVGTVNLYQIVQRLGRQLDPAEVEFAKAHGVYVKPDEAPSPVIDRSGFNLENGSYKINSQSVGSPQAYSFTLPKDSVCTVSIEATEGTSFGSGTIELQGPSPDNVSGAVTAAGGLRLDEKLRSAGAYTAIVTVYDPQAGSKRVLVTLHYS